MSFGSLSQLYSGLFRKDQIELAKVLGLHSTVLLSWLHTFTYVRNICAHHGRLWNRQLAIAMIVPKDRRWEGINAKMIISVIFAIKQCLSILPVQDEIRQLWQREIEELFAQEVPFPGFYKTLGLNTKITQHPLWLG